MACPHANRNSREIVALPLPAELDAERSSVCSRRPRQIQHVEICTYSLYGHVLKIKVCALGRPLILYRTVCVCNSEDPLAIHRGCADMPARDAGRQDIGVNFVSYSNALKQNPCHWGAGASFPLL